MINETKYRKQALSMWQAEREESRQDLIKQLASLRSYGSSLRAKLGNVLNMVTSYKKSHQ